MRAALLAGALFAATAAHADYVLVTHEATIFEQPQAASRVLAAAGPGDRLEMVTPRSESGYYLVRFGDDEDSVPRGGVVEVVVNVRSVEGDDVTALRVRHRAGAGA
jgi:hypothetical protein